MHIHALLIALTLTACTEDTTTRTDQDPPRNQLLTDLAAEEYAACEAWADRIVDCWAEICPVAADGAGLAAGMRGLRLFDCGEDFLESDLTAEARQEGLANVRREAGLACDDPDPRWQDTLLGGPTAAECTEAEEHLPTFVRLVEAIDGCYEALPVDFQQAWSERNPEIFATELTFESLGEPLETPPCLAAREAGGSCEDFVACMLEAADDDEA